MKNKFWLNLFLVLAGIVVGTMLSHFTANVNGLSWLAYGLNFGTTSPVVLELGIINFTFGISLSLTVSTVLCIAISLVVGKLIVRK